MVLTVTSYGMKLRKHGNCIVAESPDRKQELYPVNKVESLVLTVPCSLTSEVITLCMENNIPLTMMDKGGMPLWKAESFEGGSTPLLHRQQLLLPGCPMGVELVRSLLSGKLTARRKLLQKLAANRKDARGDALKCAESRIKEIQCKIEAAQGDRIEDLRPSLLGYEGTAGRIYFSALASLLPPEADFHGRERGNAAGPFNCMINYGYGVLTREILSLCRKVRLDPYLGVMHTDGYNRLSLVYDLMEPFRAHVEGAVFKLFSRRMVHVETHFISTELGMQLSNDGKKLLLESLWNTLDGGNRKNCPRGEMEHLISTLAKRLLEKCA